MQEKSLGCLHVVIVVFKWLYWSWAKRGFVWDDAGFVPGPLWMLFGCYPHFVRTSPRATRAFPGRTRTESEQSQE